MRLQIWQLPLLVVLQVAPAMAGPVFFSTGNPDGLMAAVTRPGTAGEVRDRNGR